ncbi:MAG TPA: lytic transglycosylase domain-containing protein [Candidatus Paceibacterota bacterium]|nr:lytic transglycosylase domain-containing protein [Verrucomicrobiota bacterium]HRY50454.1 lytic transglycosylase domain-containing protein [Candidatus Paceibacterota bacterium]HRZ99760.1 lytic transglycosylase domain-containing protein [Candidatus Paceibacterota bacterium]
MWFWILVVLLSMDGITGWWWWRGRREHRYDREIIVAARRYGIEAALIKAVIWRESSFESNVRGSSGELGLMQIRPAAAQEWAQSERIRNFSFEHLQHPQSNILAGTWYLWKLMSRYRGVDNPVPYALADYNAGRSNSLRWNSGAAATNSARFIAQIGFPKTKLYVESVLRRQEHYRSQAGLKPD